MSLWSWFKNAYLGQARAVRAQKGGQSRCPVCPSPARQAMAISIVFAPSYGHMASIEASTGKLCEVFRRVAYLVTPTDNVNLLEESHSDKSK